MSAFRKPFHLFKLLPLLISPVFILSCSSISSPNGTTNFLPDDESLTPSNPTASTNTSELTTTSTKWPTNPNYKVTDYSNGVLGIQDQYGDQFYLIQGSTKALLLDTGLSRNGLKSYIEELCPLPYEVVLTHGDDDHSSGCYEFSEVYIDYKDLFLLEQDTHLKVTYDEKNEAHLGETLFHPLTDTQSFDLGDRTLEVITTPGHTPGSIVLIDKKNKMLFAGDSANNQTQLMYDHCPPLQVYYESLLKLEALEADYDTIYICHPDYTIDKKCISNLISICDEVLSGSITPYPYNCLGISCVVAKKYKEGICLREDEEPGNLVYDPNNLR